MQHILASQLDSWKHKRSDAERGQAIAEAALDRLRAGQSLTVDELCELIRRLEMTRSQSGRGVTDRDFAWVTVDPAVLDSYAGFYRGHEFGVMKVWREGQRLFHDAPIPDSTDVVGLHALSETDFYPTNGAGVFQYTFLRDAQGAVTAVGARVQGVEFTFARIDTTAAEQLKARLRERVKSQMSLPRSEAALRRLVDGIQEGSPPYEQMSPQLEQLIRHQLPGLQFLTEPLGRMHSVEFRGVGSAGWDQYDVHREHGTSRWQILVAKDGKVVGASLDWDRPGPSCYSPRAA